MRADALRNQEAVLAAAGRLFDAAVDPDEVSMDAIAAAAGVGKGTLFRRFGDRAGLVLALYERRAEHLRTMTLRALSQGGLASKDGPASQDGHDLEGGPAQRALALLVATVRFKQANRVLTLALENDGSRSPYRTAAYEHWHRLLTALVIEARGPEQADYLAHVLLGAVRSDLVEHLRPQSAQQWHEGLRALVQGLLGSAGPAPRQQH
ncbi:helix-turn-helix domain-containing protein [Micromonospora rifamycinica]|uniref:TetR/AcrR family transcriptional regulator n=1 Tax=Micromonospora rifamycinica TaxID=291594 RepID=UPI0033DB7852